MGKTGRYINISVSPQERERFYEAARDMDVPYYLLMRHLARYVVRDGIDWGYLLKKFQEWFAEHRDVEETKKVTMRTQLTPELYAAFTQFAEEWGSTANAVMRRLILLYSIGEIERHSILTCDA